MGSHQRKTPRPLQTIAEWLEFILAAYQEDVQKGRSARPQRAKGRGVRGWHVEALSDARTKLEDFFNILLGGWAIMGAL